MPAVVGVTAAAVAPAVPMAVVVVVQLVAVARAVVAEPFELFGPVIHAHSHQPVLAHLNRNTHETFYSN